jgi:hypothetical protein
LIEPHWATVWCGFLRGSSEATKYFLNLLVTRSKFLSYVNRYQEALADIEQSIRLSVKRPKPPGGLPQAK